MQRHAHTMSFLLWCALVSLFTAVDESKGFSGKDKEFFEVAASGGMTEVALGQLAQDKAKSPDVKSFGRKMVSDHAKANNELKQVAQAKNSIMPIYLEEKDKSVVDRLSVKSGAGFDKEYMKAMVECHAKDVTLFSRATERLQDAKLMAWASNTLPVLEQHSRLAKETAGKLRLDVRRAAASGVEEGRKEIWQPMIRSSP